MTTDIVTRLRAVAETGCDPDLPHEAAAEIERLRAVIRETHRECQGMKPGYHLPECRIREIQL